MTRIDNRKRVVVFVSSLASGGAERVAVRVCGWLLEAGHEVCLLTLSSIETDFYETPPGVLRVGLGLQQASRTRISAVLANIRRAFAVRNAVRRHHADVVVCFGDRNNVLMLLATMGVACRKIISERADPVADPLSRGWSILRKVCYPMASLHVSQSAYVSEWITRHFPSLPCQIIGNTGDLVMVQADVPERKFGSPIRFIAVGRLTRQKGIDLLLQAFSLAIEKSSVSIQLVIVGDGEDREALITLADTLGIRGKVEFLGRSHQVRAQLELSDVFVLSSRYEGFPNVMIEAMTMGLPVIAARCPGGVEDILDNADGPFFLDYSSEDVMTLAKHMLLLATDENLRDRLGLNSLRRAADYSPERISKSWLAVVDQS